mgnify:CR=1 FL=1
MHDRLNQNDVTNKIDVEDPDAVREAVLAMFAARLSRIEAGGVFVMNEYDRSA